MAIREDKANKYQLSHLDDWVYLKTLAEFFINNTEKNIMSDAYKPPSSNLEVASENNSGQGKMDYYPEGVTGWSWGAFFLKWT